MSTVGEPRTVLAIGAHPGNIELLCAGALALLKQQGWRIVMATLTPGKSAESAALSEDGARSHVEQATRSAAVLDAEYRCLESADFTIFFSDAPCRHVTGLIRAARPELVLTHSSLDHVADHSETSRIVRQACVSAPVRDYLVKDVAGGEKPTGSVPHLYYVDPPDGKDFLGRQVTPSLIVDVSSVIETKEQMLALYTSQRDRDEHLEKMRKWSRQRGQQAGCTFGEGFRQHLGDSYPSDDLLKTALRSLTHATP